MALEKLNLGTAANTKTGEGLRTGGVKINALFDEANRIGIDQVTATSEELNILHNLEPNTVDITTIAVMTSQTDGAVTDGAPTDAELDSVLGITAAAAGKNYTRFVKDTSGSALVYLVVSDGSDWFYLTMTKAT